ncbi:MAG: DinB family protein [Bacteroidota bacterium]|nr:DinB family protein [Bacteroidota bacterium]
MAVSSPTVATPPLAESQAQLRQQLHLLTDFWKACPELELSINPGPGRWSRKEILGHLIDSALNNHRRTSCAPTTRMPGCAQPTTSTCPAPCCWPSGPA